VVVETSLLKATIDADLKNALLSGERFRADVLRGLKAAILNEEVAQGKRDEGLANEEVEKIVAREVKKRAESVELYIKANRQELADNEKAEAAVLSAYLPEQLSEADIQEVVDEIVASLEVRGPQAMGQVIGAVKSKLGNSADGAVIARLVKQALSEA